MTGKKVGLHHVKTDERVKISDDVYDVLAIPLPSHNKEDNTGGGAHNFNAYGYNGWSKNFNAAYFRAAFELMVGMVQNGKNGTLKKVDLKGQALKRYREEVLSQYGKFALKTPIGGTGKKRGRRANASRGAPSDGRRQRSRTDEEGNSEERGRDDPPFPDFFQTEKKGPKVKSYEEMFGSLYYEKSSAGSQEQNATGGEDVSDMDTDEDTLALGDTNSPAPKTLEKVSMVVVPYTDLNEDYVGCIAFFFVRDPNWDAGMALQRILSQRQSFSNSKYQSKGELSNKSVLGPSVRSMSRHYYNQLCGWYMENSVDTSKIGVDKFISRLYNGTHPLDPRRVFSVERALSWMRKRPGVNESQLNDALYCRNPNLLKGLRVFSGSDRREPHPPNTWKMPPRHAYQYPITQVRMNTVGSCFSLYDQYFPWHKQEPPINEEVFQAALKNPEHWREELMENSSSSLSEAHTTACESLEAERKSAALSDDGLKKITDDLATMREELEGQHEFLDEKFYKMIQPGVANGKIRGDDVREIYVAYRECLLSMQKEASKKFSVMMEHPDLETTPGMMSVVGFYQDGKVTRAFPMPISDKKMGIFGNFFLHFHSSIRVQGRGRIAVPDVLVGYCSILDAYHFVFDLHMFTMLRGAAGKGKSYIIKLIKKMTIKGSTHESLGSSEKSMTGEGVHNDHAMLCDEAPPEFVLDYTGTNGKKAATGGATSAKQTITLSMITNGTIGYNRLEQKTVVLSNGTEIKRYVCRNEEVQRQCSGVMATNYSRADANPAMADRMHYAQVTGEGEITALDASATTTEAHKRMLTYLGSRMQTIQMNVTLMQKLEMVHATLPMYMDTGKFLIYKMLSNLEQQGVNVQNMRCFMRTLRLARMLRLLEINTILFEAPGAVFAKTKNPSMEELAKQIAPHYYLNKACSVYAFAYMAQELVNPMEINVVREILRACNYPLDAVLAARRKVREGTPYEALNMAEKVAYNANPYQLEMKRKKEMRSGGMDATNQWAQMFRRPGFDVKKPIEYAITGCSMDGSEKEDDNRSVDVRYVCARFSPDDLYERISKGVDQREGFTKEEAKGVIQALKNKNVEARQWGPVIPKNLGDDPDSPQYGSKFSGHSFDNDSHTTLHVFNHMNIGECLVPGKPMGLPSPIEVVRFRRNPNTMNWEVWVAIDFAMPEADDIIMEAIRRCAYDSWNEEKFLLPMSHTNDPSFYKTVTVKPNPREKGFFIDVPMKPTTYDIYALTTFPVYQSSASGGDADLGEHLYTEEDAHEFMKRKTHFLTDNPEEVNINVDLDDYAAVMQIIRTGAAPSLEEAGKVCWNTKRAMAHAIESQDAISRQTKIPVHYVDYPNSCILDKKAANLMKEMYECAKDFEEEGEMVDVEDMDLEELEDYEKLGLDPDNEEQKKQAEEAWGRAKESMKYKLERQREAEEMRASSAQNETSLFGSQFGAK